jgi:hypothetical protein
MVSVIRKYYTALLLLVISAPGVDSGWGGGGVEGAHVSHAKYTCMRAWNLKRQNREIFLGLSQAASKETSLRN